jgi:hypothetical protein
MMQMLRKVTWIAGVMLLAGPLAWAQGSRVEVSGTAGWTFSDGVTGNALVVPGIGTFDRIDPKDAFSWGLRLGFMASENMEIGFLYDQQATELDLGGTTTVKLGDESIHNYHGYFAYNFGDEHTKARPYFLIGLGATQYGTVNVNAGGVQRDISGETRFSGTAAVGVKAFTGPKFGFRFEGRWTPTYIKSDATGWWCDPYWGCYLTGNAQYSNQFELSGGLILRF